jgi:hypothetical protein
MVTSAMFARPELAHPQFLAPGFCYSFQLFRVARLRKTPASSPRPDFQIPPGISSRFLLSPAILLHFSALFCSVQKPIPPLFKQIPALSAKHPGWACSKASVIPSKARNLFFLALHGPRNVGHVLSRHFALSPFVSHLLQTPSTKSLLCTSFQKTLGGWVPTPCASLLQN